MDGLILAGRILFAAFFLNAGIGHLTKRRMLAGYVRSSRALPPALEPAADLAVVGTGLMLLAGSVMVAAGIYPDLGTLLLAAFLVPTTPLMHAFWKETDPMRRLEARSAFLRNVTYLGVTLLLFAFFVSYGLGLTITDPIWTTD